MHHCHGFTGLCGCKGVREARICGGAYQSGHIVACHDCHLIACGVGYNPHRCTVGKIFGFKLVGELSGLHLQ